MEVCDESGVVVDVVIVVSGFEDLTMSEMCPTYLTMSVDSGSPDVVVDT